MQNSEPCFFLEKIPGEMRNRIYDYALSGENGEMTLHSSDMIAPLRRFRGGKQESKVMHELRLLEQYVDATEPVVEEQQSSIDQKEGCVVVLESELQRLRRAGRAQTDESRGLGELGEEIPNLENEVDQMLTYIRVAKRGSRVIRSDYLLRSKEGEAPVFRDMQNLFSLSRTCKQIREECSGLVYEFNKVKFIVGTEENRTEDDRKEVLDKHFEYILERQLKLGELKMGLIIDFGFVPRLGAAPGLFRFNATIREYQSHLRKLRKACPLMEIHFFTDQGSQQLGVEKHVAWKIVLDGPESVVAQFDAQLAASHNVSKISLSSHRLREHQSARVIATEVLSRGSQRYQAVYVTRATTFGIDMRSQPLYAVKPPDHPASTFPAPTTQINSTSNLSCP
ncbi:uncharacterized protein MYCFIDRAFT_79637 [Pseudocercospora fijiensis CIRAD86]|uniref:Uncharacterized protein n=1 Tax=Pseudocercospora fijiensis (strain CIRAD86) TaxID=383855 RepID=M2ZJK5_PSEFD|nr:uncharacterized protein MYCFIDRAFT_79637 [Pseudocercospora fijiensis CIRAD86]EME79259.1 hypothetical protein MYCFIDRAFT_79637 [Pseudocercospora fijiensis CIRAD86]